MKAINLCRTLAGLVFAWLTASTTPAQEAVDNVVIVLDSSGSMANTMPGSRIDKMTAAKAALKQVLKSVPQNTHIGQLVFSAKGADTDWFYPLGPRDDLKLTQAIDRPLPGSGTPLGKYIKKGADRLLEERAKQSGYGTFRLIIVTDGEADDQREVDRYTPEVIARGITVDAIGVAMNERHTLAIRVHSYRSANDPASLKRAVAEAFGEIGGRGNDSVTAETFAEIESIPAEAAQAMIQALSSSGNHPIGERPPVKREQSQTTSKPQTASAPASPPVTTPASPATPAPAPVTPASDSVTTRSPSWSAIIATTIGGLLFVGVFGLIILAVIIR